MDMEILITILLCVIAAIVSLLSLFLFAKRREKSYEQVKQDELKADLALSKELSNTPRSKASKQYKPWSRKKKADDVTAEPLSHVIHDAVDVMPMDPTPPASEVVEQPVKPTKKKRQQQSATSPPTSTNQDFSTVETSVIESSPSVTVEAVLVEESVSKPSNDKQKKPSKLTTEQPAKQKLKKSNRKDGDVVSFNDLSSLLESSSLRDDQIQDLVDMLLTRKDGGWQSTNKADDSVAAWKRRFTEVKEQCEDVQKEKNNLTATVKRQREEITQHQNELRQHKLHSQQKLQQLTKEIGQLKVRLQSQEEDVSSARATLKNHQQLQEEHGKMKHQLTIAAEKERQAKLEITTLHQSAAAVAINSNGASDDVKRIRELEETLAQQQHHYSTESVRWQERVQRLEVERKQVEDRVNELESIDLQKQQELRQVTAQVQDLQHELDIAKEHAATTQIQVRNSSELHGQVEQLIKEKESGVLHHQEEVQQLNDKLEQVTLLADRERQSHEAVNQQLEMKQNELLALQQQLELRDQQLSKLQQDLHLNEEGLAKANQELQKNKEQIVKVNKELQLKEEGLNAATQELHEKDKKLTEIQHELHQKGEGLTGLQEQLHHKGEGLSDLQLQLQQRDTECEQMKQELADALEQVAKLKLQCVEQQTDSVSQADLNEVLQKKEFAMVEMKRENEEQKEKVCDLEKQVGTLEERIDQLLDLTVQQKQENKQTKEELEKELKEQIGSVEKTSREQGSRQTINECKSFLNDLFPDIIISDSQDFTTWKELFKTQIVNGVMSKLNELEVVQSQLMDKESQEANFAEEKQKLMETLEATKGMLEDLQEELESHDKELQQKLSDAESKLEQEKVANRLVTQQLQSEQDQSNSLNKQLQQATKDKDTMADVKMDLEDQIKNKELAEKRLQEQFTTSHEQVKTLEQQIRQLTDTKNECLKANEKLTLECKNLTERLVTSPMHRPVNESSV